jgi:hypothetical protein
VPTVWELYGSYIADATCRGRPAAADRRAAAVAARLRRADNTIRAREASLRVSYDRIRQMAGRLINAQEAARAEIARDLHDDVCQRLTSVSIGVGSLKNATGRLEDPKMQEGISELDRETRDAFESSAACRTTSIRRRFACWASPLRCARIATRSQSGTAARSSSPVRTASAPFIPTSRSASFASRRNRLRNSVSTAARSR